MSTENTPRLSPADVQHSVQTFFKTLREACREVQQYCEQHHQQENTNFTAGFKL